VFVLEYHTIYVIISSDTTSSFIRDKNKRDGNKAERTNFQHKIWRQTDVIFVLSNEREFLKRLSATIYGYFSPSFYILSSLPVLEIQHYPKYLVSSDLIHLSSLLYIYSISVPIVLGHRLSLFLYSYNSYNIP
jgi:hypothetical protein